MILVVATDAVVVTNSCETSIEGSDSGRYYIQTGCFIQTWTMPFNILTHPTPLKTCVLYREFTVHVHLVNEIDQVIFFLLFGSTFKLLECKSCHGIIGRCYQTTPRSLDHIRLVITVITLSLIDRILCYFTLSNAKQFYLSRESHWVGKC